MFESLFGPIEKWINEHGSSAILTERIALLHDKMQFLAEDNERMQEQLRELKAERDELRNAVKKQTTAAEYTEHRGVLFRRLPDGKIQDEAYCPDCMKPMNSLERVMPYKCSICKFNAGFTGRDLMRVISEIQ